LFRVRAVPVGFDQVESVESASIDDALRSACLMLANCDYRELSILDGDEVLHDLAGVQSMLATRDLHPQSLVASARRILNASSDISRKNLARVDLLLHNGSIVVRASVIGGPVFEFPLNLPGWETEFKDRPEDLASCISERLPSHGIALPNSIVDRRYLFLRAFDDLYARCLSDDEYTMLGIAALLRLLLWDGGSNLTDQVNRTIRFKLVFHVGRGITPHLLKDHQEGPIRMSVNGLLFQAVEGDFHRPEGGGVDYSRDAFYALPVLQVEEHVFSVLDLMRHMAYIGGMVHALDASDERDQALHEFRKLVNVAGVGPGLRTLRSIGRVVIDALKPLRYELVRRIEAGEA
jgi:hypothetical protein